MQANAFPLCTTPCGVRPVATATASSLAASAPQLFCGQARARRELCVKLTPPFCLLPLLAGATDFISPGGCDSSEIGLDYDVTWAFVAPDPSSSAQITLTPAGDIVAGQRCSADAPRGRRMPLRLHARPFASVTGPTAAPLSV